MLKRLAALFVPSRAHVLDRVRGGVEELVEALLLVGREPREDVVDGSSGPARRSRSGAG